MPKTKSQEIIFSIMMVIVMVYGMVTYNVAINMGGLSNKVFLIALMELPIMGVIAFLVEGLFVSKIAHNKASKIVNLKKENPFMMIVMMSIITVCLMCPIMSFIATIMHHGVNVNFIANWFQAIIFNFPMALCYQLFYAGPFVRFIFSKIFN
ncbi:MAG: DUF2798 domain-containing protein [Bacilli bacterium]|nr:DUF2798 domain-containing protein [Bacilli bacterium]